MYSAPSIVLLQNRSVEPLLELTAPATMAPSTSRELPVSTVTAPST